MEQMQWLVTRRRNGKSIWTLVVLTEAQALEAAGLRE
jgi:hypothetical protein